MNADTSFVKLTSSLHISGGSCANPTVSEGLCWGFPYTIVLGISVHRCDRDFRTPLHLVLMTMLRDGVSYQDLILEERALGD